MKKIFVLLAVFAAVGIFAGAGAFAAPADKVLTIGVDQEAVGLDPDDGVFGGIELSAALESREPRSDAIAHADRLPTNQRHT